MVAVSVVSRRDFLDYICLEQWDFTQQASFAEKVGKQMMSKHGLVHIFQAHLIPSEAVNHGNVRAIRPS